MEEGIEETGNGRYEMPLPFKERPVLRDNHSMALIRLEHLKRKFLKDPKYKEDYVKFMNEVLSRAVMLKKHQCLHKKKKWSGTYLTMASIIQRKSRSELSLMFSEIQRNFFERSPLSGYYQQFGGSTMQVQKIPLRHYLWRGENVSSVHCACKRPRLSAFS